MICATNFSAAPHTFLSIEQKLFVYEINPHLTDLILCLVLVSKECHMIKKYYVNEGFSNVFCCSTVHYFIHRIVIHLEV